jgi:hypothetical protein
MLDLVIEAEAPRAEIQPHMKRRDGRPTRVELFAKDCEIEMLIQ